MRGRKPLPSNMRVLRGNPGRQSFNNNEPMPERKKPECPMHLTGDAKKEWFRIVEQIYSCGLLTIIDERALSLYCEMWQRYIEANENLKKTGLIVKSPNGYPIQNPYLAIVNKSLDQMRHMLSEFGMTPSSRSRINVMNSDDPVDNKMKKILFGKPAG